MPGLHDNGKKWDPPTAGDEGKLTEFRGSLECTPPHCILSRTKIVRQLFKKYALSLLTCN